MNKKILFSMIGSVSAFLMSCGKGVPLATQEMQRNAFQPELQGTWTTACAGRKTQSLTFDHSNRLTFSTTTYFDPECEERERTVEHGGKYALAHTIKEGVPNSIVFQPDNDLKVVLYTDNEVDAQNNVLAKLRNEMEKEFPTNTTPGERKNISRENAKIRAVKTLENWKRDEPKTLSRFQLEKLAGAGLQAAPVAEQSSRIAMRYETDNGYLQIAGTRNYDTVYYKPEK